MLENYLTFYYSIIREYYLRVKSLHLDMYNYTFAVMQWSIYKWTELGCVCIIFYMPYTPYIQCWCYAYANVRVNSDRSRCVQHSPSDTIHTYIDMYYACAQVYFTPVTHTDRWTPVSLRVTVSGVNRVYIVLLRRKLPVKWT